MKKVGIILLSVGIAAFVGIFAMVFIMMFYTSSDINRASVFFQNITPIIIVLVIICFVGIFVGASLIVKNRVKNILSGTLGMPDNSRATDLLHRRFGNQFDNQLGMLGRMSQMMKTPQAIGTAKVITVTDTGKVLGANPIVSMQLEIAIPNRPNSTYQMETQVQSSAIPQVGDTISIGIMPGQYANQFNGQQTDWVYMGIVK